ncbi:radical SAM protein [Streptomyces inusitatus]|nr:radical SAM protein [Streptomyces inusitatus]
MNPAVLPPIPPLQLKFAWLEVTGFCNLECTHCYADSSPKGTHGTMAVDDWKDTIDQLADMGVESVQFIGGEPCLYPHLAELIDHVRTRSITGIEVFSNLTQVSDSLWETFVKQRVDLATSYYSDTAAEHDTVTTRRGSHTRTRANIQKAKELGLAIRGATVQVQPDQRGPAAHQDLQALGVNDLSGDRQRPVGRASMGAKPTPADLCGHCAQGRLAISPNGDVWPCTMGRSITVGNIREAPLSAIWNGTEMETARTQIEQATTQVCAAGPVCLPACGPCLPSKAIPDYRRSLPSS